MGKNVNGKVFRKLDILDDEVNFLGEAMAKFVRKQNRNWDNLAIDADIWTRKIKDLTKKTNSIRKDLNSLTWTVFLLQLTCTYGYYTSKKRRKELQNRVDILEKKLENLEKKDEFEVCQNPDIE
ncbi:MAG: hypothetical protein J6U54_13285 [Clostridiales bacterium]|nr:hypothetical protein [Clostridiales bacterium]